MVQVGCDSHARRFYSVPLHLYLLNVYLIEKGHKQEMYHQRTNQFLLRSFSNLQPDTPFFFDVFDWLICMFSFKVFNNYFFCMSVMYVYIALASGCQLLSHKPIMSVGVAGPLLHLKLTVFMVHPILNVFWSSIFISYFFNMAMNMCRGFWRNQNGSTFLYYHYLMWPFKIFCLIFIVFRIPSTK